MGILIPFDPAHRPKARRPAEAIGPARILLFTGVRYERRAEPAALVERHADPGRDPRGKGPTRRRKRA